MSDEKNAQVVDETVDSIEEEELNTTDEEYEKPVELPKQPKVTGKTRRKNPEDVTEADIDYIYSKRRTYTLEGKERNKHYKEPAIATYNGEQQAKGERKTAKDEATLIMASARAYPPKPLTGIVVGYSETENAGIPMMQVELENSEGNILIKIPMSHFFAYKKEEYEGEKKKLLASLAQSFFGARIRFVVYEFQEAEGIAYGSRLKAMEMLSAHYYRKLDKDGNARVRVGEAATATVLSVSRDRVIVDVLGADVTIKSRELDWLTLGPVDEKFHIGDTFPVKILEIPKPTKIEVNSQPLTLMLDVKASRKALLTNPNEKYFDRYKRGDIVSGVINSENTASGLFVNIQNHITVLCDTVPGNPPIGSTCSVLIVNKYDDDKQIRGNVIPNSIRPPKARY